MRQSCHYLRRFSYELDGLLVVRSDGGLNRRPPRRPPALSPSGKSRQDAERRESALLGVVIKARPTTGSRVVHFAPPPKPRSFLATKTAPHFLWVPHQAQEKSQIAELIVGNVIDLDGASLNQDRP